MRRHVAVTKAELTSPSESPRRVVPLGGIGSDTTRLATVRVVVAIAVAVSAITLVVNVALLVLSATNGSAELRPEVSANRGTLLSALLLGLGHVAVGCMFLRVFWRGGVFLLNSFGLALFAASVEVLLAVVYEVWIYPEIPYFMLFDVAPLDLGTGVEDWLIAFLNIATLYLSPAAYVLCLIGAPWSLVNMLEPTTKARQMNWLLVEAATSLNLLRQALEEIALNHSGVEALQLQATGLVKSGPRETPPSDDGRNLQDIIDEAGRRDAELVDVTSHEARSLGPSGPNSLRVAEHDFERVQAISRRIVGPPHGQAREYVDKLDRYLRGRISDAAKELGLLPNAEYQQLTEAVTALDQRLAKVPPATRRHGDGLPDSGDLGSGEMVDAMALSRNRYRSMCVTRWRATVLKDCLSRLWETETAWNAKVASKLQDLDALTTPLP